MEKSKPQLTEYHVMLFNALTLTMLAETATIDVYRYQNNKTLNTKISDSCKKSINNARVNLAKASEQQTRDLSIRSFDIVNSMLHKVPEIYNALILLTDEQKTVIANNVARFTKLNMERQ